MKKPVKTHATFKNRALSFVSKKKVLNVRSSWLASLNTEIETVFSFGIPTGFTEFISNFIVSVNLKKVVLGRLSQTQVTLYHSDIFYILNSFR